MITFYDEKGNGYGAQVELKTKNAVNGERSISGTIVSNTQVLSRLDRGWSFTFDGELYKIIYAKPKDEGKNISLSFDAVHQFFYDFEHSNCYQEFNGSNRFEVYIEAIFKNSGYRYVIEAEAKAIRKENFGNASRLKMFKDIIKAAGLEFSVTGKVVRILKKVGTDLSTVVRKNFNMNELTIEKNIGNFITYKKGLGAWKDENNHDAGRYTSEYESPLARIYGRIEGEPVTDERYKETGKLLERLKKEVDESYSISVQLGMEDLTQAGYKYTRPRAGDYIMAINETIGFREKIRIVSYESSYDVTGQLLSHKVTCNDIGTVQKAITSEGSIMRSVSESKEYAEGALEVATRALVSANGKNTNYYGATKPKDEPRGTLHEGDLLYLTVGEETELYYWSGTEWLPKILKVDTRKIETLLSEAQKNTNKAIEQANATAREALEKAGTLPDTSKLSDQIKQQILSSPDLQNKVTEGVKSVDGDTIYSKIVTKLSNDFADKNTVSGLLRDTSNIYDKVDRQENSIRRQTVEFNKLTESNKVFERILGTSETGAPDKLSRLVMSSDIFQTEVGKYVTSDNNLIVNSETMDQHVLVNENRPGVNVSVSDGIFTIKAQGATSYNWSGFTLPIYVRKIYRGETYSVGFKYRIRGAIDYDFNVIIKNHILNRAAFTATAGRSNSPVSDEWKEFQGTFYMSSDFEFGNHRNLPFYVYVTKNGWVEIKEIMLVRGSRTGPYKPSQFDDVYKASKEAKDIASDAQAKAIQVAQGTEAVRTQMTQLAGSWAVRNLNNEDDVLNSINVLADGNNRIDGRLTHITGQTVIDEAVIDGASIKSLSASKLSGGEADFAKMSVINFDAKNVTSGTFTGLTFRGGRIESLDGTLAMDLNNKKIRLNGDNVGIVREFDGYPTQFIRYESSIENGQRHAKTIIGSNRDGSEAWNSVSFAGIVIDNNSNNGEDGIKYFGDTSIFRHSASEEGWNLQTVTQTFSPATWRKNSEIWARHIVVPRKTKSDTDNPVGFVRLEESVAALWRLWAHAKEQVTMSTAMRNKIRSMLDAWSFDRPIIS